MTEPSAPSTLAEALPRYPVAYLLTVTDASTPHVVAVTARLADGNLQVAGHGRRSTANAAARRTVTVLFPAATAGEHALIVDGDAADDGDRLAVTVRRAVLHRSGDADSAPITDPCVANCVELEFQSS